MKKDNVFSIVAISCGLIFIMSVFLPYVTYFSSSVSLWKMEDPSIYIYILLGVFVMVLYLINKKTELSYLAVGYGLFSSITTIITNGFSGLSLGFYLIMISSIIMGVMTFIYNEKEGIELIGVNGKDIDNNAQNNN